MGRKKLYATEEERNAAAKIYRKTYYQKNRLTILEKIKTPEENAKRTEYHRKYYREKLMKTKPRKKDEPKPVALLFDDKTNI